MEIIKTTVAGCKMRITMASAPVSLGLLNNESKIIELLQRTAETSGNLAKDTREFLKSIGYYKLLDERKRLVKLIEDNPGIVEREEREEAERDRNAID